MQKRWTGNNVDLDLLGDCIEDFFKGKGFVTKRTKSEGEQTILWVPWPATMKPMTAKIVGDSNNFVLELKTREFTRRDIQLGMLTKSIGGGYFLRKGLRLREALEKIEREFWVYIEDKVADLAGSAEQK